MIEQKDSKHRNRWVLIIQPKQQRKKQFFKKKEQSLRAQWDNFKKPNCSLIKRGDR